MSGGDKKEVGGLSALALIGQVGFVMAFSIVGGVLLGVHLDRWLGTGGIAVILMIFVGIAAGVMGVYRIVVKEIRCKR